MPKDPAPDEPEEGWESWGLGGKRQVARFFIDGDKTDRYGRCQGVAYRSWGDLQTKTIALRRFKPRLFKNICRNFRNDVIVPKFREAGFIDRNICSSPHRIE